jgi:hypothetical protein
MEREKFERYLIAAKSDAIENAAYALAVALLCTDSVREADTILRWDMAIIGPLVDAAQNFLENIGKSCCHQYF